MLKIASKAMIKKVRVKEEEFDVCPYCNEEIREKSLYFDGKNWYHKSCKSGPIMR